MWRLLGQVIQTDLSLSLRLRLTLRKVENTRRNKIVRTKGPGKCRQSEILLGIF